MYTPTQLYNLTEEQMDAIAELPQATRFFLVKVAMPELAAMMSQSDSLLADTSRPAIYMLQWVNYSERVDEYARVLFWVLTCKIEMKYIRKLHTTKFSARYLFPLMESILRDTYNVLSWNKHETFSGK